MLELILGPINLVNGSKTVDTSFKVDDSEEKTDKSNQSDVAIACTAMSCSIEDNKDSTKEDKDTKSNKDVNDTKETQDSENTPSTSNETKQEDNEKGNFFY